MAVKDNLKMCELDLINAEDILQSSRSNSWKDQTTPFVSAHCN